MMMTVRNLILFAAVAALASAASVPAPSACDTELESHCARYVHVDEKE